MQVKYILTIKNVARYFDNMEEAVKMAKWAGISVGCVKEVHVL